MRLIDAAAVAAALPFEALLPALETAFVRGCALPPRQVLTIDPEAGHAGDPPMTALVMPAWDPGGLYLLKSIQIAPGNAARGLPGLHASVLLHDAVTGVPLAWLDGSELTSRRTAAVSALAAGRLAPPDARRLLVVGAGRIAALLPAAYRVVRPGLRLRVWARRPEAAAALADGWRAQGFDAEPAHDLASAVAEADIVSCATLASEPLIQGRWLRPGSHLDLIGSFTPAMREADDDALRGAELVVDADEALAKSGDLIGPLARGVIPPEALRGTLAALLRGEDAGRSPAFRRSVFKSVGTALADLAAATLVWQRVAPAGGG